MLAEHGQPAGYPSFSFKVTLDPDPGHLPAFEDLLLPHHRHVVFGITGHHAGRTADTAIQIDHHAPAVFPVRVGGIEIFFRINTLR